MNTRTKSFLLKKDLYFSLVLFIGFFLLVYQSTILQEAHYCRSDPHGTLLTAQSLLEYGTIKLDAYHLQDRDRPMELFLHAIGAREVEVPEDVLTLYMWQIRLHNNHLYSMFPVGSALISLPAAAAAYHVMGMDMTVSATNWALQRFLAALTVALIAVLSYYLARSRIPPGAAFILTLLFIGGASLTSTCGTALWSFNYQILFILTALHLLQFSTKSPGSQLLLSSLIGLIGFLAYLCRPTTLTFIVAIALLLILKRRLVDLSAFLSAFFAGFAMFMLFSYYEYRLLLPPYYAFSRIDNSGISFSALSGLLVSPSRGLFIFSPFLLLSVVGAILCFKREKTLILFTSAWIIAHLVMVSSMFHWWGGYSYGPRLLTDCLPAFFLLTVLILSNTTEKTKNFFNIVFLVTGIIAFWIHSVQGLYTPATYWWNIYPNIDQNPERIRDWRYPQFLASDKNLKARVAPEAGFETELP